MTTAPQTGSPRAPVVGLAFSHPIEAASWSGAPAGLRDGLRANGVEVVEIVSGPSARLARVAGRLPGGWRVLPAAGARRVAGQLRGRSLDAILAIGSDVHVRADVPIATYEDMTVRQAIAMAEPYVTQRSPAEIDAWIARQAAIYAGAASICTMGQWAADSIVDDYGIPAERVHVVGAGANHVVPPTPRDWAAPRFLFVGREFERKNGPTVLKAFARLRAERPDARLDVVGGHPPISADGVVAHGALKLGDAADAAELADLFRLATCFVMPSRYEPFGIVYAEAAATGIASIATDVGGSFVDDGCGRRVDPGDEEALLAAMRELADPDVAQRLGAAALERSALYTWPQVAGRILASLGLPAPALAAQRV